MSGGIQSITLPELSVTADPSGPAMPSFSSRLIRVRWHWR